MVLFGRASFLTGVIAGQSQIMSAKVEVSPKLGGVKKKRHGHNFDFSGRQWKIAKDGVFC